MTCVSAGRRSYQIFYRSCGHPLMPAASRRVSRQETRRRDGTSLIAAPDSRRRPASQCLLITYRYHIPMSQCKHPLMPAVLRRVKARCESTRLLSRRCQICAGSSSKHAWKARYRLPTNFKSMLKLSADALPTESDLGLLNTVLKRPRIESDVWFFSRHDGDPVGPTCTFEHCHRDSKTYADTR
jgi:hypothetical protein